MIKNNENSLQGRSTKGRRKDMNTGRKTQKKREKQKEPDERKKNEKKS